MQNPPIPESDSECILLAERIIALANEKERRAYKPREKQLAFHASSARWRGCYPSNRWGKSTMAALELHMLCSDTHMFKKRGGADGSVRFCRPDRPLKFRAIGDGFTVGIDQVMIPIFQRFAHPKQLAGGNWSDAFSNKAYSLTYADGSVVRFMSYRQAATEKTRGAQAFEGDAIDGFWMDEHGPLHVWKANKSRIIDYDGFGIDTLTPLYGKTWEYFEIFEAWQRGDRGYECWRGNIFENLIENGGVLTRTAIDEVLGDEPDQRMRRIRMTGDWVDVGGLIYPMYDPKIHFIPYDPARVRMATKWGIIDPHPSNPIVVQWCGIDADERKFTYREHAARGTAAEIATDIRRLSAGEEIPDWLMDPHWYYVDNKTTSSWADDFHAAGIPVKPATKDKWGRIETMRRLLTPEPISQRAMFEVMDTCPETNNDFRRRQFDPRTSDPEYTGKPRTYDVDDHNSTCCEYFVHANPRFTGRGPAQRRLEPIFDDLGQIRGYA